MIKAVRPVSRTIWRSMTKGKILEGVFAVNKPQGLTSAQVIRDLQQIFDPSEAFAPWLQSERRNREREQVNQRNRRKQKKISVKIGHGGTLDPLATGVLITGVGKGTKSLQDFLLCTKVYEAVVLFGTATDTYDRVGKVLQRAPYEHITREAVEKALDQFRGKFKQTPPLYSALKMNGKPLYEYAREGKEIPREIEKRDVEVLELELIEWMEGGTHNHKAPSDEAGHQEVNIANMLWKKQDIVPAGEKFVKGEENFESKKRKLRESHDELVTERPPSKKGKVVVDEREATMSGGLPPPDAEVAPPQQSIEGDSTPEVKAEATPEPAVKGPPAMRLRMVVTSGFYVRSLCHELGAKLGSAALMAELERTRQGDYEVGKNVLEYADLKAGEQVWGPKVENFLDEWAERTGKGKPKPRDVYVPEKEAEEIEKKFEAARNGAEVKEEVKTEVKTEVKEEPKAEVKAEIKEEVNDAASPVTKTEKVEVKEEVKEEKPPPTVVEHN